MSGSSMVKRNNRNGSSKDSLGGQKGFRIAMISEHASPLADPGSEDTGGQNVYVAQVAQHLARLGYQIDIFTRKDDPDLAEIHHWVDGVRVIHVPAGPPRFIRKEEILPFMDDFVEYFVNFSQTQDQPYSLVHAHFWMSGLVAAEGKRILGLPFVITFHALGKVRRLHQGKEDGFPDSRFAIEERVISDADSIIAECPQDKHDLTCLYDADPSHLAMVPCGFDPGEIWAIDKQAARKKLGLPKRGFILLQIGRLVPRKGIDNVIRGLARLVHDYGVPAQLLVVGGASEKPDPVLTPEIGRLQAIAAEEGVSDLVTFTGRRNRDSLKYYYSAADVFISTPWYEPFGITPIEAMACGTPVIGSNVGGIKYSVRAGETGFLVPPNDPSALAQRLAYLYKNPQELELLGRNALKRSHTYFTWEMIATSLDRLYQDIISKQELIKANNLISGFESVSSVWSQSFDKRVQDRVAAAIHTLQVSKDLISQGIIDMAQAITQTLASGGKLMVCGNGGSASQAGHFAAEFVGRFQILQRQALPVLDLTANPIFLTAWSNDLSYDDVFSRQVEAFGEPGDVLLAISTSGRSRNLISAFDTARSRGIGCLALVGGDGGDLFPLADAAIVVPDSSTTRIQEVHILVLHIIAELVEEHFADQLIFAPKNQTTTKQKTQATWPSNPTISWNVSQSE